MMTRAILLLSILIAATMPAGAADCASAASREAASRNAQVLKVESQNGQCVITMRVPGAGGQPPRVETVVVNG